jgi:CHASE3 domain sensor protein
MEKTKSIAKSAAEKTGLPLWVKYFVVAGGAVISIVAVFIYHWR